MTRLFGIYGVGGCGRGIMPIARAQLRERPDAQLVFIDDHVGSQRVNGHEVLTFDAFLSLPGDDRRVAIAIASSRSRQTVAERCAAAGASFFEVRAAHAIEKDDGPIGRSALISPVLTVT